MVKGLAPKTTEVKKKKEKQTNNTLLGSLVQFGAGHKHKEKK